MNGKTLLVFEESESAGIVGEPQLLMSVVLGT